MKCEEQKLESHLQVPSLLFFGTVSSVHLPSIEDFVFNTASSTLIAVVCLLHQDHLWNIIRNPYECPYLVPISASKQR